MTTGEAPRTEAGRRLLVEIADAIEAGGGLHTWCQRPDCSCADYVWGSGSPGEPE